MKFSNATVIKQTKTMTPFVKGEPLSWVETVNMLSGMASINLIKVFQCIPKTADYQFGPRRLSSFGFRDRVTSRHRLTCSLFTANQFILFNF